MRTAYFDCFGGASGDMILGALLDAGANLALLRVELARLGLAGFEITRQTVTRGGLRGLKFDVQMVEPPHEGEAHGHSHEPAEHGHAPHRGLADILALLDHAGYAERVDSRARQIFRRLAAAEAKVHGTTIEQVHFHEVGAIDSIVDIVGSILALEQLGIERIDCSPIPLGTGTVHCQHGVFPVPAPATAELMRDGVIAPSDFPAELCTPTGAAILTTLAESFGPLGAMAVEAIGYGAGGREDPGRHNLLRVFVGEPDESGAADTVVELAANIDDAPGELIGAAVEMLLAAGALDAWTTPIGMKKNRPAVQLGLLCRPEDVERLEEVLFSQTTTIGIRRHLCQRTKLSRRHVVVETPFGAIRVKVSGRGGRDYTAAPEFDDCARAATAHHVPIKEVQAVTMQFYRGKLK
jgi:hypothetical protein